MQSSLEPTYRRNFYFFLLDGILFSVAIAIIGSNTLVPDFVRRLTDSEIVIGLSGSMFEVGWMMPQLFIARYIIRSESKKWWFVGPNIPVRFVVLIFAVGTVILGKDRPEAILIAFLIAYAITAIGDGVVGVPWADLTGTSLDSRWRSRMFGFTTAGTGLIMLALTPVVALILKGPDFPNNYALLFGISGVLFILSIFPVLFVQELPGGKAVEKIPALSEFLPELGRVLREDAPFRTFVFVRMFTSLFMMAAPFYIGFATESLDLSSEVAVPTLTAMQTIGGVIGALVYTRLGARDNLMYIRLALFVGALWPLSALLAGALGPIPLYIGYLISGFAVSNIFLSYFNWVVGYTTPDQRPIYVGLFNTISAVTSLLTPIIGGTIVQNFGYSPVFVISFVMAMGALFVTMRYLENPQLDEIPEMVGNPAV